MLKREENHYDQAAGEVRVKKEELARAISILEARRQAEAQEREGTVVIGDVLQQLQITTPPEEVLHEIEALREGQPQEEVQERLVDPLRAANVKLIAGIVLVPLAAVVLGGLIFHTVSSAQPGVSHDPPSSLVSRPYYATNSVSVMPLPPLGNVNGVTGREMDEGGFNASSVLKPLSAVPDNQPVHCSSDSLRRLISGEMQRQRTLPFVPFRINRGSGYPMSRYLDAAALADSGQEFDVRPGLQKPWTLIKHDGSLYVRGWVALKFTPAQAQEHPVVLRADPHSFEAGITPQQITLKANFSPFYGMPWGPGPQGLETQLSVRNAAPDSHAWEKW